MTNLRTTITRLANQFADGVLEAIRGASLEEILAEAGETTARGSSIPRTGGTGKGGRLGRRSAEDIAVLVDSIVGLLEKHPSGLRAEQIRQGLALEAKELPRPLSEALAAKRISKEGQKRSTTYFVRNARVSEEARGGGGPTSGAGRGRSRRPKGKGGGKGRGAAVVPRARGSSPRPAALQ